MVSVSQTCSWLVLALWMVREEHCVSQDMTAMKSFSMFRDSRIIMATLYVCVYVCVYVYIYLTVCVIPFISVSSQMFSSFAVSTCL